MEGKEQNNLPEVEPRGQIEYQDKNGMMHFFDSAEERADFIAEENNPDNK